MDFVTGAIGSIISKLSELLKDEYKLQTGVKKQVESLTHELESAGAFLRKIDKVHPDQLDEQVKIWAREVREASYDMEDVLDAFLVRVKGPKPVKKKKKLKRLKEKIANLFTKTMARHDIGNAIEEVNKKLNEIDERRRSYKLDDCVAAPATPSSGIDPRIAQVHGTNVSMLVGINESKDAVVKILSHDNISTEKTRVLSIVGFGGLGKTTLAKVAYDQLKQKYECGAFVSVGRDPNLVKVFKDIFFNLDKNMFKDIHSTQKGADLLIPELLQFLGDKRYLIVIDDVWEIQSRKRITEALAQNNLGSRIIITTRNSEVATGEVYKLLPLSVDNSKKLFYARLFGGEDRYSDNQQHKVSDVAHKILRKCGGVPLAIITMASLLVGKSMEEWFEVCDSIGFREKDKEQLDDTMWILSLSYYDLPSHLKTCLLYLSVFPEDYLIEKDVLIWMWIGEGFVNGKPGSGGLFEIGERYFNDLINRSLIQPVEDEVRSIKGCRVHDMILDLIRNLSREANFAMVLDTSEDTIYGSDARRLALQNRVEDNPLNNHTDTTRAWSLFAFMCRFSHQVELQRFKLLRVLYLDNCNHLAYCGRQLGDLLHLRYLGICRSITLELLKEIGALKFLRVLYLGNTLLQNIESLPSWVSTLTQLVCLRAWNYSLPGGKIKNLTSLEELHIFVEDDDKSTNQFVNDLGNLHELRVLRIRPGKTGNCWADKRVQSDFFKSLGNLHKLQRMELKCWIYDDGETNKQLFVLPLPRGLCELALRFVPELPPCIDPSRLPNLSHLSLALLRHLGDEGLKILGELPELRYLNLHRHWDCSRAMITGTAAHGYFQKLRSCVLDWSTVQFVVNEEDSSVSFNIWGYRNASPGFIGSKKKQDNCRGARAIMPNLEVLCFAIDLNELMKCNNGSWGNLGLECLPSLQKVIVPLERSHVPVDVIDREEAALRRAIQAHPNRPTIEISPF